MKHASYYRMFISYSNVVRSDPGWGWGCWSRVSFSVPILVLMTTAPLDSDRSSGVDEFSRTAAFTVVQWKIAGLLMILCVLL